MMMIMKPGSSFKVTRSGRLAWWAQLAYQVMITILVHLIKIVRVHVCLFQHSELSIFNGFMSKYNNVDFLSENQL